MNTPNMLNAKIRNKTKVNYKYEVRNYNPLFIGKRYYIKTYGCQMNMHDTEEIKAILDNLGYEETLNLNISDIVILNTCAIRENAHDKVFGFLGRLKHLKQTRKDLIIGLCGCMAQEESVIEEIKNSYPYIDIIFGTHNINELPNMLINLNKKQAINVYSMEGDVIEFNNVYKRESKVTAWVNIMYGCDKFCTYCIVPFTRGKQRSRKSEDILKEINNLILNGYQEVTLLGQNVNAYGKDLESEIKFSELLLKISDTLIPRIRFVTSHPWDFTDKMIDVIASRDNIMPYIHLPIQSGSNKILKLMGRRYTKEEYLELFSKIKSKIKNVAITTDIIVGFPSETENDFNDTIDIVNKCQFDGAYTFVFSARNGTPAANFKDSISLNEKQQRLQKLNKMINQYSKNSNLKLLNTIQKVLIIAESEKDKEKVCGYTENMKLVNVIAPKSDIGKIINVKINEAKSFSLDGEKIN